jgi:hypothetical protein
MHIAVVYDANKRKHNSHNSFYLYMHHCWDFYKFCSCMFYDVHIWHASEIPGDKNHTTCFTNITSHKTLL